METYKSRHIQRRLQKLGQEFKVVLLTGMRQCGKTTLLKELLPEATVVTFEMSRDVYDARRDPDLFSAVYAATYFR